jgi:hypothetical protein
MLLHSRVPNLECKLALTLILCPERQLGEVVTHVPLQFGAMLVSSSDVDDTLPSSVTFPVIRLGFEIRTTILIILCRRVCLYFDLLEILHDGDGVESARSGHDQLLDVAILQDFDNRLLRL